MTRLPISGTCTWAIRMVSSTGEGFYIENPETKGITYDIDRAHLWLGQELAAEYVSKNAWASSGVPVRGRP